MRLFHAPLSPFARKVRVVLAEKGLAHGVEEVVVNPWEAPAALTAVNPISQVPALELDDGRSLFGSAVICAWLDAHGPGPRLIPEGEEQWRVRRLEAAADAIMETAVKLRQEALRPEPQRSAEHVARWRRTIPRTLDALESEPAGAALDLGEIALAAALEYVDFRLADLNWRDGRPRLEARWRAVESRPSFVATRPA